MTISEMVLWALGSGGLAAILSVFFVRKSSKEKNRIDLLDRAFKEIERLDEKVKELELEVEKKEEENDELRKVIRELRESINSLMNEIKVIQKGR